MVVDVLVDVALGLTVDLVITLVCTLGKFNESKNGVRGIKLGTDNSLDSIGLRLALGPCRDDVLLPAPLVVLVAVFVGKFVDDDDDMPALFAVADEPL